MSAAARTDLRAQYQAFASQLKELNAQLGKLKAELEKLLASDHGPGGIPAEQLEQFSTRLEEEDDVELVSMLLALRKLFERGLTGRRLELAQFETVALIVALQRFAPEPFERALSRTLDELAVDEEWRAD